MPAPASAASRAAPRPPAPRASPASPTASATDESRHSYAGLCRARHQPVRGLHRHPRRPLRAFLRFRQHAERQARRCATSRSTGYRAARLDLERLPRAVAPPAILHDDLDQLHQRPAGRHQHARGQQPGRARARLARPRAGEVGQPELRRDRQSGPRPDLHGRLLPDRASTTASCSPRISAPPAPAPRAVNAAVKALLDANGFQSVGAARFFINGLDTTTQGVDAVASYRFQPGLRQLDADRGL